jgi:hypothetical protein
MILPADVEVDWEAKRLYLVGREMVVGVACQGDPDDATDGSWFHLMCGENGWYLELVIWGDGTMVAVFPHEPFSWYATSVWEVLIKWKEGCEKTEPLPSAIKAKDGGDYFRLDPYGGCAPGTWLLYEKPSPEKMEMARKIIEKWKEKEGLF